MLKRFGALAALAAAVQAHGDHAHDQEPLAGPHKSLWYNTLPGDGGTQVCNLQGLSSFKQTEQLPRPTLSSQAYQPSAASNTRPASQQTTSSTTSPSSVPPSTPAPPTDQVQDLVLQAFGKVAVVSISSTYSTQAYT